MLDSQLVFGQEYEIFYNGDTNSYNSYLGIALCRATDDEDWILLAINADTPHYRTHSYDVVIKHNGLIDRNFLIIQMQPYKDNYRFMWSRIGDLKPSAKEMKLKELISKLYHESLL